MGGDLNSATRAGIASPRRRALAKLARRWGALFAASALLVAAHFSGVTIFLDNELAGARARIVQRAPTGSIVVVAIDTRSLRAAGEWPWPRERFASAIHNLRAAGASLIGFDVDFSTRSASADDVVLHDAIEADPGSVVLPTFMQPGLREENSPLASLSQNAVLGSVNVRLDPDGRVRRYHGGYSHDDHYHASMAAVLAGASYGDTDPFLIDYGIRSDQIDRLSFEDVYRSNFDPERVRGKTILIGATALELGDEFSTPIVPAVPGVVVHALAYESIVQGRMLMSPNGVVTLALAFLTLLALWPRAGPLELPPFLLRQGVVLSLALLGSLVLQAIAPVSLNLGLMIFAQALCICACVNRELSRRARELVRQREQHLSFVATHDPETDLPNRRAMIEELNRRLEGADSASVVVAVAVGIDRFTTLRAAIGYGNANRLMSSLSAHIAKHTGQERVFHISTSVLGAVMTAGSEAEARQLCLAGFGELDTSIQLDDQEIEAGIRTGIAVSAAGGKAAEKLLEHASLALDEARLQSRRFAAYDPNAADPAVQLALVSDVAKGLRRGEFSLRYQAKACAQDGRVVGAEALMRWAHPVHGDISPDDFITVAEETGAIHQLTRWALQQAIADQRRISDQGVDVTISVNVSGRSLCDREFCAFAVDAVLTSGARICLEITETAIIEDPIAALSALAAFRAAGIGISVDDYGSGLSSLAYLKQISADELKLDKSLIRDLKTSTRDRLILKSTIDLAHSLDMTVVAEGVEDEADLAVLAAMGCDCIQGYVLSRPVSLVDFTASCLAGSPALVRKVAG